MLNPAHLVARMGDFGFGPFVGVPCSYLGGVIAAAEDSPNADYLVANNEGEAVAVAAGLRLAGASPAVIMQNSGLGNAVNPLTSLVQTMAVPMLLLITWRGQPGRTDEPQHTLMGAITRDLLDAMSIRSEVLPDDRAGAEALLATASRHLAQRRSPFAVLVPKGTVGPYERAEPGAAAAGDPTRAEVIELITRAAPADAAVIATTGKTARELEAMCDRAGNLYVVGSMGCASSVGLGVALRSPARRVIVIDGDGAALMRLEAMATIGRLRPPNLGHVVLDNAAYESTGGQATGSPHIDFPALARSCGYPRVVSAASRAEIAECLRTVCRGTATSFGHIAIRSGSDPGLGRPTLPPPASAARFQEFVTG
ncbi:phosphonopyruvate decarboxylase [Streptomyces sp. NPDC050560]|uniref:phosphonopyruvate decarboxylase n=1 Tax=Streptomyces sp. NPDC050560 TaxID=3365630 RepID=UPI00379E4E04